MGQRQEILAIILFVAIGAAYSHYTGSDHGHKYKIGLVADLGIDSRNESKGTYFSYYKEVFLTLNSGNSNASVLFDNTIHTLESGINDAGEGFELSALVSFQGKLYTCDDETGILYEIVPNLKTKGFDANPSILLSTGRKGLKCEWTAIKDGHLYVGSSGLILNAQEEAEAVAKNKGVLGPDGKPLDRDRFDDFQFNVPKIMPDIKVAVTGAPAGYEVVRVARHVSTETETETATATAASPTDANDDGIWDRTRQIVAKVSPQGVVSYLDWTKQYQHIAKFLEVDEKEGFVIHEAIAWSPIHKKWLFAPRKISKVKWNKDTFELTGSNIGILVDDEFLELKSFSFGTHLIKTSGFTDLKFLPDTNDALLLGLKSNLNLTTGKWFSSLSLYDLEGHEVMADQVIGEGVYTGFEVLNVDHVA